MRCEPALDVLAGGTEPLERRRQLARPAQRARSPEHAPRRALRAAAFAAHLEHLQARWVTALVSLLPNIVSR